MRALLVTGGHPFASEPFFAVFDQMPDLSWRHVSHPAAQADLVRARLTDIDVVVFYDMPGIEFTRREPPLRLCDPSPEFVADFEALLDAGQPMVFLHHAIAGWPTWDRFAHIVGGRFHYRPARLDGIDYPSSGYRFDVTQTIEVLKPDHAICAGLPPTFAMTDEAYLFPVFEDEVVPLLRSRHDFSTGNFWSADLAIRGQRDSRTGWSHPTGSDLVAWVKHASNAPIAYVQFGDGPATYVDPNYRRIVANTVHWAASAEARDWARNSG